MACRSKMTTVLPSLLVSSMFRSQQYKGFTLIEVLVALAVLAIGLLGLAGMQMFSMGSTYDAHLRTQATVLAQEIIDRMRANAEQARTSTDYVVGFDDAPITASQDCQSGSCSPQELAEFDMQHWKCALGKYSTDAVCNGIGANTLPSGDGSIVAANNQYQVTVGWTNSAGRPQQVTLFSQI